MTVAVALAAIGCTGIGNLQAAPIDFAEGGADLSDTHSSPTGLGALEAGVNTITGGVCFGNDPSQVCLLPDDLDAFDASLAAGLRITSVTFTVSGFDGANAIGFVGSSASSVVPSFNEVFGADGQIDLFSGAASGPGDLVFFENGIRADQNALPFIGSYFYVWSITVEPIDDSGQAPVPATLALLGLGLAGLGWSRRNK